MAKLTLNNISSINASPWAETTINANNDAIEAALENTLSRNGAGPNTMGADLDMNSYRVVNLPTPIYTSESTNKAYVDNRIASVASPSISSVEMGINAAIPATSINGPDKFPVSQNSELKSATAQQIADFASQNAAFHRVSRGGLYEGSLSYLNEPGANNFAKASENVVSVFRGQSTNPSSDMSYARTAQFVEVWNATALNNPRSIWGNPYKISAITVEHIATSAAQAEVNGASFRAYSATPPANLVDPLRRILVGLSAIGQTNSGDGNASWEVWGGNIIAAQTSGNTPQNIVGLEVDVLNKSSSVGLFPGEFGATNYTGVWAQSDAQSGAQSDTAFLATHTEQSGGWRQILQAIGLIRNWAIYIRNTWNNPSGQGAYIETTWQAAACRILELVSGGSTRFRVTGDINNPVHLAVNGTLENVIAGAEDSGGLGRRALTVPNAGAGGLGVVLRARVFTVATLPAANSAEFAGPGAHAYVSDATATTFHSVVVGGGANFVPVFSDGSNWRIG